MVLSLRPPPEPCVVVIFGASGDLAGRKLGPALHNLQAEGLLPEGTAVLGTARTEYGDEEFRDELRAHIEKHSRLPVTDGSWADFSKRIYYVPADVSDAGSFERIGKRLKEIDGSADTHGNRIWYAATVPSLFPTIAEKLGDSGLCAAPGWDRIVIEKPFGNDLRSAHELNEIIRRYFSEDQIYRIDHYLGKETVQNLLVFRFANAIFEPIWNRRYVDHVQITVAEDIGIEDRAGFYERAGALRDVGQNHLLQLLSLIAMEPPVAWDDEAIRDEKTQVLRAVRRWSQEDCPRIASRGQYAGYTDEPGVDPRSRVETFFAAKFMIDNWRWEGVPFYVRTGKRLPSKATEIAIQFKAVPHLLFAKTAVEELEQNELVIRVQPDEGISLRFGTKVPGPDVEVRTVDMEFDYESDFGSGSPEAYERLLLDCMIGDATLFTRSDEIEEAWEIVDPIMSFWSQGGRPGTYEPGTWGPPSADELVRADGHRWRDPSR